MCPTTMKKFKVPPPVQSLPDPALQALLSDTNLLRTALLRYAQVPLALMLTLVMGLTSWLAGRPLLSFETFCWPIWRSAAACFW